ncbi:MAG: alpha/beta fold hydrolase [Mariprofundaceae bacterium]
MRPVFLHGWGQSARIWAPLAARFPGARFLDLPGHGAAPSVPGEAWLDHIAEQLPDTPLCLVGWSLGGILAMDLALAMPDRVRALVLVATTPRFCMAADWPHGCAPALFADFRRALEADDARLAERFFLLMLQGSGMSRAGMRALSRAVVDKARPPRPDALATGLAWLERRDLRAQIPRIRQPALVVHGRGDAIVPEGAGRWLAGHLPDGRLARIGGGHAPFLAETDAFVHAVSTFLETLEAA